jgi:hypothetical protein
VIPRFCVFAVLVATANCFAADQSQSVTSAELGLQFRAPPGWIVRHLTSDDGEPNVAITRELLDGFPRYRVGFSAASVNVQRSGDRAVGRARGLCAQAQQRRIATTKCLVSQSDEAPQNEWAAVESVGADLMSSVRRTTPPQQTR